MKALSKNFLHGKKNLIQDKQGIAIALSLPEEDESKIKEKVFDQIPLDDLKSDDGFTVVLHFLDKTSCQA